MKNKRVLGVTIFEGNEVQGGKKIPIGEVVRRSIFEVEEAEGSQEGYISFGGSCLRVAVPVVQLGLGEKSSIEEWKLKINESGEGDQIYYTDGSMSDEGKVGGGWFSAEVEEKQRDVYG